MAESIPTSPIRKGQHVHGGIAADRKMQIPQLAIDFSDQCLFLKLSTDAGSHFLHCDARSEF